MIDAIKACKIATENTGNPYVESIKDVGDGFVIGTLNSSGETPDIPPFIIYKQTGDIEMYFPPEHIKELKNGKNIDVPDTYKYTD